MLDSLKQAVYTSLGLASMTSDKISEAIRELTKKADLTEKEVKVKRLYGFLAWAPLGLTALRVTRARI